VEQVKSQKDERLLRDAWLALIGTFQAANNLVPGLIVVGFGLAGLVILVAVQSVTFMLGIILLIVLISAIAVLSKTRNFSEATVALIGGLLTAFAVKWTPGSFVGFVIVWAGFLGFALLIWSSILGSNVESICVAIGADMGETAADSKAIAKRLQTLLRREAAQWNVGMEDGAKTIQQFAVRGFSEGSFAEALKVVGMMRTITGIDAATVASVLADTFRLLDITEPGEFSTGTDFLLALLRRSHVLPGEFFRAFTLSRGVVRLNNLNPGQYFQQLERYLDAGVTPEEIFEVMRSQE
jgi:hypothetical protein